MNMGLQKDGSDACAVPLADQKYWDLRVLIAITTEKEKQTGSGPGMRSSEVTSPYYNAWVTSSPADLNEMNRAVKSKDFQKLGELSEHSCLKMHAVMLSSQPALIYWNNITLDVIHLTYELRKQAIPVYFTIDAGPQVKLITLPEFQNKVFNAITSVPGIKRVIDSALGPGAYVEESGA